MMYAAQKLSSKLAGCVTNGPFQLGPENTNRFFSFVDESLETHSCSWLQPNLPGMSSWPKAVGPMRFGVVNLSPPPRPHCWD